MPHQLIKDDSTGKCRINRVPIFGLGETRGFLFDGNWVEMLKFRMAQYKDKKGYLAPVIIGHNGFGSELYEKEAVGFLDNYECELTNEDGTAGTLYADIVDIPAAEAEKFVSMKYPYRSVEVYASKAEITALALLGGTEPHFKFPRLEVYKADGTEKPEQVDFMEDETGLWHAAEVKTKDAKKSGAMKKAWAAFMKLMAEWTGMDDIDDMDGNGRAPAAVSQPGATDPHNVPIKGAATKDNKELDSRLRGNDGKENFAGGAGEHKGQEDRMPEPTKAELDRLKAEQDAQFKSEHGMTPEEMAAKYKAQAAQAATDRVTAFKAKLDTYKVLPAIRDEAVKIAEFAKDEASEKALFSLLETVLLKAQKNELFADTGEHTLHNDRSGQPAIFANDNELFDAIEKRAKKDGLTFEAAKAKVLAEAREV